jgi:hypothetical protein
MESADNVMYICYCLGDGREHESIISRAALTFVLHVCVDAPSDITQI